MSSPPESLIRDHFAQFVIDKILPWYHRVVGERLQKPVCSADMLDTWCYRRCDLHAALILRSDHLYICAVPSEKYRRSAEYHHGDEFRVHCRHDFRRSWTESRHLCSDHGFCCCAGCISLGAKLSELSVKHVREDPRTQETAKSQ